MNQANMNMNGGNIMEMMKSQMMSMMMIKNMSNNSPSSGFEMVYILIVTQIIDVVMKYLPLIVNNFYQSYLTKFQKKIETKIVDGITKTIKSSITVTVKMNDSDNATSLALMDYITNNKNTSRVSYKNKGFVLNQQTDIQITPDIYAIMRGTNDNSTQISESNQTPVTQIVEIYSYTKTVDEMRNFMDEVQKKYIMMQKNRLGNNKYYFNMVNKPAARTMEGVKDFSRLPPNMVFSMKRFQTNRKFSNLFGDDISTIKDRVNFFTNNKDWYDEKGIPYTIGLLLSGLPGTGKTSTIKCLANETERHIFNINFNNDITKTQMENLFFNEQIIIDGGMEAVCIPLDQRIYVFEDIDCQNSAECISRTHSKQNQHQLDLSFLLNLLDGVLEMPGRIIILTSNNPERLDHALVRPGRIDIVANYTNCTNDTIIRMIEFFYNNTLSDAEKQLINKLEPLLLTPAEVSKLLFENFGNKDNAVLAIVDAIHNFYRKGIDSEPVPEHVPEPVSEPVSEPLPEPVSEPLPEPVYVEPFSNHAFETTYAETKSNITSPAGDDFIPSYPGMFYDGTQNFDSKPQTNKQVWHNDIHIKNPQNNKKTPEYVKELDKLIDIKDQSETTLVNNSLQYSEMENLVQELKYRSTMLDNLYQRPSETRNPNYDIVA